VFSTHDVAGGRSYKVTSLRAEPTYQELQTSAAPPPAIGSGYLTVPDSVGDDIAALASKVTAGAATPYEKAIKLQNWFTQPGNFTYSLNAPAQPAAGALRDFLFVSKIGYCNQFASSMAVMARILGIPSRVGMGYTAGARQPDGGWIVRTKDAHSWPELYFSGIGWLRFEPTPGGDAGQGTATAPSYTAPQLLPGAPGTGAESQLPTVGSVPNPESTDGARPVPLHNTDTLADQRSAPSLVTAPHKPQPPVGWAAAGLVAILLLLTPAALRRLTRVRRWARANSDAAIAHAAWDEVRAEAADHGLRWPVSDTPRSTARRLVSDLKLDGAAAEALARLSRAEERARYAPDAEPAETLRADVRELRRAFKARARWSVRLRAVAFPPSATATLRRVGGRILDTFDWLDVATMLRRRNT
jgi:transglutaminase-like putative cysteine protease